jgi:sugar transferase (PEP-CTERM/EpsH1 system associated)
MIADRRHKPAKVGTVRRKRVIHVTPQLDMGGMEKLLVEFARHTNRERFELVFVCLSGRGALADAIEACGWPVVALDEPPGLRVGRVVRLARLFRRLKADVVHTHNTNPLLYAVPAAHLAGVPVTVHTRHGHGRQASRRRALAWRMVASMTGQVVCVSRDCEDLSRKEGVPPGRLCTIRNGIDTQRFDFVGPADGGPAVMVGRLSPEKDVESLVRATALVARDQPNFRLEVAGGGPLLADLRQRAGDLGLGRQVRFLGEVREVPSLLARAALFVMPSLREGISLAILEAMARGLPVIATRVGGNPEVIADGETGLLVPPRDPQALARALAALGRDPERARRLGAAGRLRVERHFDVRRMVAKYEQLYLGQRGGARSRSGGPRNRQLQASGPAR